MTLPFRMQDAMAWEAADSQAADLSGMFVGSWMTSGERPGSWLSPPFVKLQSCGLSHGGHGGPWKSAAKGPSTATH